jgi:two-component system OmpR family sensor kinase
VAPDCLCYDTVGARQPSIPVSLAAGHYRTVHSHGTAYRVYAVPRPGGGLGIAAAPLTETEQTLHRLLRESALVILAILVALGALSWWLVRIGLRPLERMGLTAGAIAAGDLSAVR